MAKKTNIFLNDIKNYDLIRDMLRHIYMYGNYSKGDIVKNHLIGSERSVYDMINRIKNYLTGAYLTTHKLPNRKQDKNGYRFKYDPFQCPINYLADTYRNCSYIVEDFIYYFTLLQSFKPYTGYNSYKHYDLDYYIDDVSELTINGEYTYDTLMSNFHDVLMTNEDILQKLKQSQCSDSVDSENLITPSKARDRLAELVELGIIRRNNNMYSLAPDILEEYEDYLEDILLMVQFFYNFTELCIPGYYLATTLSQYLITLGFEDNSKIITEQENPVFFYKNCSLQNVIDDNVFWDLLTAISSKYAVNLKYKNKIGNFRDYTLYPIKIVIEKQYGRHYLYAYNYLYENFILLRLDSISNVNRNTSITKDKLYSFLNNTDNITEQINKLYEQQMSNVWNITTTDELYDVLIHFSCPKDYYLKLLNRVNSTGRNGIITPIDDTSFDYRIQVKSYIEMKPWIRAFGEYALVDKITSPELFEDIKNDYRKAYESYEII